MISTFRCLLADNFFPAEIYEINLAAKKIGQFSFRLMRYTNVDSLVVVKTLNSCMVKLKCFDNCLHSLTLISYRQVDLIWIPGHQGTMVVFGSMRNIFERSLLWSIKLMIGQLVELQSDDVSLTSISVNIKDTLGSSISLTDYNVLTVFVILSS